MKIVIVLYSVTKTSYSDLIETLKFSFENFHHFFIRSLEYFYFGECFVSHFTFILCYFAVTTKVPTCS